jgi:hypothetical protein
MSEATHVISHNFTTIRGDSYEQFLKNLTDVYGEEDGKSLAALAFNELRNHFLGVPNEVQAQRAVQSGLGATAAPAYNSSHGTGGANPTQSVALNVPYEKKEYVKQNGARWSQDRKAWTVPAGHPLTQQFPVKG